jgi:hypothetical protein
VRTAVDRAKEGFPVSASTVAWFPPQRRALHLADRGLDMWFSPQRAWLALTTPEKSFICCVLTTRVLSWPNE